MIDFMYILAAPSPLHEPALKASFEKYKPLCLNLSFYKVRNASLVIFPVVSQPVQHRQLKKKIINVIMGVFFPDTPAIFSRIDYFQTLLDLFRIISGSTFFRKDSKRNIATPIKHVSHHC